MRLKIRMFTLLAIAGLALPLRSGAQELQGAEAALQQMTAKQAPEPKPPKTQSAVDVLRKALVAFRDRAPSQNPEGAARDWLALVDRYPAALKALTAENMQQGTEPLSFQEALAALPPPPAWNALAAEIQARVARVPKRTAKDLALLLLSHVLQNDTAAQWRDLDALQARVPGANTGERAILAQTIVSLSDQLVKQSSDPQRILQGIDLHLAVQQGESNEDTMRLPDLVTLLGPQKAEAVLRRVLLASRSMIEVPVGDATRSMARRLALELVARIKAPQWKLAESLETTELYEALAKRFAKKAGADDEGDHGSFRRQRASGEEQIARAYYFLALVVKGNTQKAAQIAAGFGSDPMMAYQLQETFQALDRSGHTRELVAFLQVQLARNPNLPFWDTYIQAAARVGQTAPMLAQVRAAVARPGLSKEQRAALQANLYSALLAADQVEEAVADMRRILAAPGEAPGTSGHLGTALQLIRLGYYLKQEAWITEGVTAANAAVKAGDQSNGEYEVREYARLLREMGRYAEAEKLLIGALAHGVQEIRRGGMSEEQALAVGGRDDLTALAQLYYQAKRYADVRILLDQAPNWMAKDVVDLATSSEGRDEDPPMQYVAAVALAETGKREEAIALLKRLLLQKGGFDPAYERLLALQGQQIVPFLDMLFRRNRFEERPLIWKAVLLQRAGQLEEAEKTFREAIAIDPSDGEEGHGDRMRAYSVLADIRDMRGDHTQGTQYREAVNAIRISEHADDLLQAGLVTRAVTLYEQALTHFADAYCIQSRLAIQMMESGKVKEAEEHYRRAYELMPSSFGRMESHCFGCEGAFRGKIAETTAEKVFQELLKKTPTKPQVHYLMGYLRDEQGRYAEALVHFREAVALDPDYINAWGQISSTSEHVAISQALRNAAGLNMMRLKNDPHNLLEVTDLRASWAAVQAARDANPPPPLGPIYPLAASKAVLEKLQSDSQNGDANGSARFRGRRFGGFEEEGSQDPLDSPFEVPRPGEVIARQTVVSLLSNMLDLLVQRTEN